MRNWLGYIERLHKRSDPWKEGRENMGLDQVGWYAWQENKCLFRAPISPELTANNYNE
jgi:hypothetical protein